jgi:lipid A 3-O-deacylase
MIFKTILTAGLMCVSASFCGAQVDANPANSGQPPTTNDQAVDLADPFTITLYWENDGSILKRNKATDRHYSNGIGATFAHQPDWVHGFVDIATFGETFDRTAAGYILGHQIFTPDDLLATRLLTKDRPYAGYLFGGVYMQRANDNTFDHAQLDIGVIGPASQADHIQRNTHDRFNEDSPNGWDHQLGDEVTAQVYLRRKWRVDMQPASLGNREWSQQLIPNVELAVGSVYRHVSAGATWRVGHNLPDDFGPGRLADVVDATGEQTQGAGGYGFIRVAGRVVQHDLFLEGNSYKDSHGVDAETFVGEIQLGIAAFYHYNGWNLQTNYSQTFISDQFDGQDGTDGYGAVMISASRGF